MRSRRQVAVLPRYLGLAAFTGLTLLSVGFFNAAWAAKPGHGSVMSPAGAPLRLEIPLYELTSEDVAVLKVNVAQQQTDRFLSALGTPPFPVKSFVKMATVGNAGETVDRCELLERNFGIFLGCDIAQGFNHGR